MADLVTLRDFEKWCYILFSVFLQLWHSYVYENNPPAYLSHPDTRNPEWEKMACRTIEVWYWKNIRKKLLVKTWAGRLWNTSPARRGDVEVGTVKRGPGERRTWGQIEAEPVGAKWSCACRTHALSLIPDWKGTARWGGVGRVRVTSRIRRGRAPQSLMLVFYQD